jgi:CRP-like cAMP-binding protein
MLSRLYRDKSLAQSMDSEEKEVYLNAFRPSGMQDVEYLKLLSKAKRLKIKKGEKMVSPEKDNHSLFLIVSGSMDIMRDQKVVNRIESYQFCGEMSYLQWNNEIRKLAITGEPVDPNNVHVRGLADAVASKDMVMYQWDFVDLYELFEKDPTFASSMERVLSQDLNNKLKTTWNIENEARYKQLLLGVLADGVVSIDERYFMHSTVTLSFSFYFNCCFDIC